ncbi:alkaline phosphatase [Tothia fuscella]|uniref:Alkaline phosphatase n=1 Tax=Tothia fuscella TaxID=1048955 RepID=A0A9P4NRL2_9PEZI|nr:alkaline phosphatase [Tothia fuscella]
MARPEEPLLARVDSDDSREREAEEEDALLTGERNSTSPARTWKFWREIGLFAWALIATTALILLAVVLQKQSDERPGGGRPGGGDTDTDPPSSSGKRNLIMMVSDGMGPTSLSLTRSFKQFQYELPFSDQLVIDQYMIGQSRTRSSNSLVTDSAAGATAFSCGKKSYNGAISVLPDHTPCGTVLEAAKKAGYMTGLVVTTRITDATPACFAAHVNMRSEEDRIAEQLMGDYPLGRVVDLILGGGRCHFLPNTTEGSCRGDSKDIIKMGKKEGFHYVNDRAGFDKLKLGSAVSLPLLGLFADTDIPYEIDRRYESDIYPSLDEMAKTALHALSAATKDSDKGFFLMIEGSRIDHAGHANDPAAQVHEVLAYDDAFASVLEFLEKDSADGIMVSTSDHETGGLATARQLHPTYPDYLWYPGVLANVSTSAERLAQEYFKFRSENPNGDKAGWVKKAIIEELGIHDAKAAEIVEIIDHPETSPYTFADMVSRRSQTGWSTHGHSAADVNIYSSSAKDAAALVGNHENTEIGEFLRNYLDVDVDAITNELKEKGTQFDTLNAAGEKVSWMGRVADDGERLDGQDHLDHYHGDFKKHKRCNICG